MAIPFLSVKVGKKGKAQAHSDYIFRQGKYKNDPEKPPTETQKDYEDLVFKSHGNMPKWAEDNPELFWRMSDEFERKNGSTYREHVISLPRELDLNQHKAFIDEWIEQEIGDKHAYQYAIHAPLALDGKENPHVHIMFSDRTNDGIERAADQYFKRYNSKHPEKGGAKKANTGIKQAERVELLKEQRGRFEVLLNKHLELANSNERISMKSLEEQGITDREPVNFLMQAYRNDEFKQQQREFYDAREQQRVTNSSRDLVIDFLKYDINAEIAKFEKRQREQNEKLKEEQLQQAIEQERTRLEREQAERQPQLFIEKPGIELSGRYMKENFARLYNRHNAFIEEVRSGQISPSDAQQQAKDFYQLVTLFEDDINMKSSNSRNDIDELIDAHNSVAELTENFNKFIDKTTIKNNNEIVVERKITVQAINDTTDAIESRLQTVEQTAEQTQQVQHTATHTPKP